MYCICFVNFVFFVVSLYISFGWFHTTFRFMLSFQRTACDSSVLVRSRYVMTRFTLCISTFHFVIYYGIQLHHCSVIIITKVHRLVWIKLSECWFGTYWNIFDIKLRTLGFCLIMYLRIQLSFQHRHDFVLENGIAAEMIVETVY